MASALRKYERPLPSAPSLHGVLELAKAACAMVPLKPNELRRDVRCPGLPTTPDCSQSATASVGIRNDDRLEDTIDDKWAFNLRNALDATQRTMAKTPGQPTRATAR